MGTLREQTLAKNREFKRQTVRKDTWAHKLGQLCPPRWGCGSAPQQFVCVRVVITLTLPL